MNNNAVSIVFFAKGETPSTYHGLHAVKQFLASYDKHPAGIKHNLVFALNGWENLQEEFNIVMAITKQRNIATILLPNEGFDIGTYIKVARKLSNDYFLFLNTYSCILADNYLSILYQALTNDGFGITGATGSWECPVLTIANVINFKFKHLLANFGSLTKSKTLTMKKAHYGNASAMYTLRRYFDLHNLSFPNIHIRLNAFFIKRKLFLEYADSIKFPRTKLDVYEMEHGQRSLTNFILQQGLKISIVGANGQMYLPQDWDKSKTFRAPDSSNLLISDNQTMHYKAIDVYKQRELEILTWGKILS